MTKNYELRDNLRLWLTGREWDYFLTLNLNVSSSYKTAKRHFGEFAQRLDRLTLGRSFYKRNNRAIIVAIPEHFESNIHFHCLVRFQVCRQMRILGAYRMPTIWASVIPSGTLDFQEIRDLDGLANYITKDCWRTRNYNGIVLSNEFWPKKNGRLSSGAATCD